MSTFNSGKTKTKKPTYLESGLVTVGRSNKGQGTDGGSSAITEILKVGHSPRKISFLSPWFPGSQGPDECGWTRQ